MIPISNIFSSRPLALYKLDVVLCTKFVICVLRCCSKMADIMMTSSNQMETFSALLAICAGNSPVPVNSPHKGQWRGAVMFSLICVWINGWVNNREAGDLRRYRTHYDVTIMMQLSGSKLTITLYSGVQDIVWTRSVHVINGVCGQHSLGGNFIRYAQKTVTKYVAVVDCTESWGNQMHFFLFQVS